MANNPKLTVLFEKLRGKTFELDKELLTAGRSDPMDICIKDGTLSSHHCDFVRTETGSYILRDNNSTNGTRINNVPITEQELKNSDIIQLGGVEILYDSMEEGASNIGSRTHTIDLSAMETNLSTVKDLSNLSPFAAEAVKRQEKTHKMMLIGLGAIALIVLALVVVVVVMVFTSTGQAAS